MRVVTDDNVGLNAEIVGPDQAPCILLMHSIGCDLTLWDPQVAALADSFRLVRFDARGHGRSDVPHGDYSAERLGRDALAVLDAAGVEQAFLCGLSLGGTTSQWLALNAPGRVDGMILANTAARIGSAEAWQARGDAALAQGMAALADTAISRFFADGFRAAEPETVAMFYRTLLSTAPEGYAGCCAVLRDADFAPELGRISVPTIVVAGRLDIPIPVIQAEALAAGIPGARLVVLEAGHLSNVEQPAAFTDAIRRIREIA